MIFNQIKELVMQFLTNPFEYGIIQFRDNFDNIIDGNRDALISEVKKEKYEIIDEIYMALEMYEENEAIRQMEPYCIDESILVEKITVLFEALNSKGDLQIMSVDASLTIDFESYSEKIFDVIKLFNESGWIFRNDEMEYLPDLDDDDTDWRSEKLSYTKLNEILSANQNSGKLTVVRLYDVYSDGVVELAASDTKEVSLWLHINRKHIEGERYTDASWYILNIVGRINRHKSVIQHFIFDEFE